MTSSTDQPLSGTMDPERLAALRRTALLDSPPEASFDRLTRLAARLLDAPVALVSLVDEDRQFFKSQCGLPEPWASRRETPLSHSFCQHVVTAAEPLVVEDARAHPLLRDNLAIPELDVVAYAGIPLVISGGHVLGSFCVIDHQPRRWAEDEVAALRDLAAAVTTEIELRLEVEARRETERERARLIEQLEAERGRLLSVFMEAPALIAFHRGPEHVIEVANPLFLRLVGYREIIGKPVREALPELEGQPFFELLDQVRATGHPYVGNEFPARWDRDGSGTLAEGYFNFVYQPLFAADGTVDGVLVHAVEVTEQVLARQRVEALAAERDAILRQVAEGVVVTDPEGRITFVNDAAQRIHGLRRLGVGVAEYTQTYHLYRIDGTPYPPDELPLSRAVLHGETVVDAEWLIRREDGTEVIAQGSAVPVVGEGGTRLGAVLTVRDVTQQRNLERQRRELLDARDQAQAQLAALLESRSRFQAAISHELRTPINGILGYNDLILAGVYGPLSDALRGAVEKSQGAARQLLDLVNDILDLFKLEAGKLEAQIEPAPLDALVEEALTTVRPLAEERASELRWTSTASGVVLHTDPRRVRQILLNLLSNAIKFGEGRPVVVECALAGEGVEIRVTDFGPGIAPEDQTRIFEEFVQLSSDRGGTGLGLPISRRLAQLLGGSLEVESRPGEGSTFRLALPLRSGGADSGGQGAAE